MALASCVNARVAFETCKRPYSMARNLWYSQVLLRSHSSAQAPTPIPVRTTSLRPQKNETLEPCLSIMPTPMLLRTLMVTTFLSFPRMVGMCLPLMEKLSRTQSRLISPDQNPVLKALIKFLFYNNFAAGENETQVQNTVASLKRMGCYGVILGYARETTAGHIESSGISSDSLAKAQIESWKRGNLQTVDMVGETDFVGIKYTGAGQAVSEALAACQPPPIDFRNAMKDIIEATIAKKARIVVDAEQWVYQDTIERWTLDFMREHNTPSNTTSNGPPIYNTMQAYLKSTPKRLTNHLKLAQEEGFTLAFKLVRGAYIASETRSLIHDTKADTDQTYDELVRNLIGKSFPDIQEPYPSFRFVIAGHNEASVERALAAQQQEVTAGTASCSLEFGQIQGMGDEITCSLAQIRTQNFVQGSHSTPKVYKALSWGTVQELMQNLIRRAVENRAAVERTKDWRYGLWKEVARRARNAVPLLKNPL